MKRNTIQKTVIMDTLKKMNCHASAGMVYEEVSKSYPTISRATVYRVLNDAAEEGDLFRLRLTEADDRFDITLKPHYHITCRRCGFVRDIETDPSMVLPAYIIDNGGFQIETYHLELLGICPACQQQEPGNA